MAITPFHFKLKKISGEKQRLVDAIHAYLPSMGLESKVLEGIGDSIARNTSEKFFLHLEAVQYESYNNFLAHLPKPAVMAVIGMTPLSHKAILEIDPALAMFAIERMLGGEAQKVYDSRALSDTEQGVLQYLLLQALANVHDVCGRDARVHFRFDHFAFSSNEIKSLAESEENVAVLVFRVTAGNMSGFARLVLPDPFVEEAFLNIESSGGARDLRNSWRLNQLRKFDYIRTSVWAEAGKTVLTAADVRELEEGDVILFDQSLVSLSHGQPKGQIVLKIGDGLQGGIDAELSVDPNYAHCRILGIHKGD